MYHAGWAWAGGTPYKSTKLVAAHFGGTRQPMAVSWPAKIKHDDTPRSQFHHVTDVVPTIYEAVGITPPRVINGVEQMSFDGISMAYTFADAAAKGRKTTQFFDIMGSRGVYPTMAGSLALSARAFRGFRERQKPLRPGARRMTCGSFTTWIKTGAKPTISPRKCRDGLPI